jgi:flagellar hook-basal body complex protein FliE
MTLLPSVPGVGGASSLQTLIGSSQKAPASPANSSLSLQEPEGAGALGAGEGAGASSLEGASGAGAQTLGGTEASSFGNSLTQAISSLEATQQSASSASQALAMGTVKDPESAVMTVEDAQLAMDLAAQLRTKATEAVQTIFQTQV